jgi:hypothetical protein
VSIGLAAIAVYVAGWIGSFVLDGLLLAIDSGVVVQTRAYGPGAQEPLHGHSVEGDKTVVGLERQSRGTLLVVGRLSR